MMSILTIAILLTTGLPHSGLHSAEEPRLTASEPLLALIIEDTTHTIDLKSPRRAYWQSFAHTAIPIILSRLSAKTGLPPLRLLSSGMLLYGISFGPCAGHFYAGDGRCAASAMLRIGISVIVLGGYFDIVGAAFSRNSGATQAGAAVFAGGVLLLAASVLYSIETAPKAAERWNAKHRLASAQVLPIVDPGSESAGLLVRMRF